MIKFFYSLAPNPRKVALLLEEAGIPYEPIPVDTRKGEQHTPGFLAINPNAKVPAQELPNVHRLLAAVDARPATQRALALKDRYAFKTEMDEESWRAMFPHMKKASAAQ